MKDAQLDRLFRWFIETYDDFPAIHQGFVDSGTCEEYELEESVAHLLEYASEKMADLEIAEILSMSDDQFEIFCDQINDYFNIEEI